MPLISPPPPTATITSTSRSGCGLQHLQPHGALARDDGVVVVGVHEAQVLRRGELEGVGARLVQRVAMQHHLGTEAACALHLHAGGEAWHHDHRAQAQALRVVGHALAPVLDLMCSHFVLTLAAQQGSKFNVRRDINGLMALAGRHLMWPEPVLARLRDFLARRCKDNEFWRGHEQLSHREFLERHGIWRGPYEEGTLFFYLDEYAKDSPKDLLALLPPRALAQPRAEKAARWWRKTSIR
jgi:hypothetical protein